MSGGFRNSLVNKKTSSQSYRCFVLLFSFDRFENETLDLKYTTKQERHRI